MRSLAVFAATLLACAGSSGDEGQTLLVFTDWIRIEATCGNYSFRGPPETTAQEAEGVDSCREKWSTQSCEYAADYGSFSSDLSEFRETMSYEELQEVISGRDAKLVTAVLTDTEPRYLAAVTIPDVDPTVQGIRLTLDARCRSSAGQQDALSSFRTLVLPE